MNESTGRQFEFVLFPGTTPQTDPVMIVFHGHTGMLNISRDPPEAIIPQQMYRYPGHWTITAPQDRYGLDGFGCWWLGEGGDFFMQGFLDTALDTVRNQYNCRGDTYTFGTSMGGFGALTYGLRWKAKGIVVN
ncbi:hypothetical protein J2847_006246 [Azospirillum agricola]|uniref:hypothetical protein n=1 Tax=Azospirillum agricola TaxID=1720247 RepID=UPI001AE6F24A|nr:hypothetical protein [Azospirillum agricola]MBP2232912.1 hypothetical protein [Azospirillum agricola]